MPHGGRVNPEIARESLKRIIAEGGEAVAPPVRVPQVQPRIEAPPIPVKTVPLSKGGLPVVTLVSSAVGIVNGAFADVGARLVARESHSVMDVADPHAGQHSYHIMVRTIPAGLVVIAETPGELDISVGVSDPKLIGLAKRLTVPLPQGNAYELAEAIATCVWPSIAAVGTPGHMTH